MYLIASWNHLKEIIPTSNQNKLRLTVLPFYISMWLDIIVSLTDRHGAN